MNYFSRACEPAEEIAMSDCLLTMKDCVMLEVIADRSRDRHDPTIPMIRQKLAGAKSLFS
jgi:hypothetical protein